MAPITAMGVKTSPAVIFKHESHKLHHAFPVADGKTLIQGMPVKLLPDGTIDQYTGVAGTIFLGIVTSFNSDYPPYPESDRGKMVTVMVEGFTIVRGESVDATQIAGYVLPEAIAMDSMYTPYKASANPSNFIQLVNTTEAGQLTHILVK